jgi:hypothetical protein
MEDLIKALQIFLKYENPPYPTHCEHDVMIVAINPEIVSDEDKKALDALGFSADEDEGYFQSYKFGSN